MSNDASMSNDERLTMPHHGKNTLHPETEFTHVGRPAVGLATAVSPDITRASTLLFNRAEDLYRSDIRGYGRHGSAGHDALIEAFNLLEGGAGTTLAQSGLAACTLPILANVKATYPAMRPLSILAGIATSCSAQPFRPAQRWLRK